MGLLDAFRKKSTEIVRDNKGNVSATTRIDADISRYPGIFDSKVRNRNYITLFSEIAEIQFTEAQAYLTYGEYTPGTIRRLKPAGR